ncbi:hypothetical protein ACQEVC_23715 [Plantactinospora sp. CA-294935]|uniref:hypothetical protein n=1 Tax=Plantactinospora sp. CA-294935 TaxID=3240012 RepID=UPI003D8F305D
MRVLDTLTLRWSLPVRGSARLAWNADGEVSTFGSSYVGDGLGSVLQAALDLQLGSSATIAYLPGEPGGHLIFFAGAADDTVYVQIVLFPNFESSTTSKWAGATPRWEGRLSVAGFITAVRAMAEALLQAYGEEGYREASGGFRFPAGKLAALQCGSGDGGRG